MSTALSITDGPATENQIHDDHYRLRSLEITGGFLSGQTFEFTDGLNCIIGGRGAGKTSRWN